MLLNCLLIVFLTTNCLSNSLDFDAADIDPDADWDLTEGFALSADDNFESDVEFTPRLQNGKTKHHSCLKTHKEPHGSPLKLPEYVRIPASQLHKELFTPGKGSIPVPPQVKAILLPDVPQKRPTLSDVTAWKPIEVMCHLDRIYVRVLKRLFSSKCAHKHLKLGSCAVNRQTATHYYFLYHLKGCGIKRGEDASCVSYTNTLRFRPVPTDVIVRDLPFSVPIRCAYPKFHRSYQTGFLPKISSDTFYMGLQRAGGVSLTVMDDSWNLIEGEVSFVLGNQVCFEAKGPSRHSARHRLYLNRCFVGSSLNPRSPENYSVIENHGCLVDSMNSSLSKFYTTVNKTTVRFCIGAFLFKTRISGPDTKMTLFMHCELHFGPRTPTPGAKSCTYDTKNKKWTELYGDASVCDCCTSTCHGHPQSHAKDVISSKSWDMKVGMVSSPEETIPEFSDDTDLFWESSDN